MTDEELGNFILLEAQEGKTDTEILYKLLRLKGLEDVIAQLSDIRKANSEDES